MSHQHSGYPDISAILADKIAGRRERAALSFAEKLAIIDDLKERIAPIIQARELRKMKRQQSISQHT
jgi:hypothetical protein